MTELLSDEIRSRLQGTSLFYPCSGADVVEPMRLFIPSVKSFWFADIAYFPLAGSVHSFGPALALSEGFELVSAEICEKVVPEDEWIGDPRYAGVAPSIRSETYRHAESGELVEIRREGRDVVDANGPPPGRLLRGGVASQP